MDLSLHYSFLPHLDPDASLAFWRDLLGFEVRNDVGKDTMRWITLGSPNQPDVAIVLQPPLPDPGANEAERRVITELMAKGTFAIVTLSSADVDAAFAALVRGGAEVVQEPIDQFYGVRDCAVRDPAGTLVRINQR